MVQYAQDRFNVHTTPSQHCVCSQPFKNTPFIREVISQLIFLQRNHLPSVKKAVHEVRLKKTPLLYRNLLALKWQKLRVVHYIVHGNLIFEQSCTPRRVLHAPLCNTLASRIFKNIENPGTKKFLFSFCVRSKCWILYLALKTNWKLKLRNQARISALENVSCFV